MVKKGVGLLRERNEKCTLAFLRANKTSSRLEIAQALGVSKNTVSLIIDKLIRDGLVRELGTDEPKGVGRPKIQIALISEALRSIGVLVQEKRLHYVVTDCHAVILESGEIPLNAKDVSLCLRQLTGLAKELLSRHPQALGIGLGIPGLVDPGQGIVRYSSRLNWINVPVKETLERELPVPVKVLNRIKAAALAPATVDVESGDSVFYLRIDEGVGGALILNRNIYHGASWTAGEIGHVSIANGPLCACGKRGCLESLVSAPAIERQVIKQLALAENITPFPELLVSYQDHPGVSEIMAQAGTYLGTALASVINLLNPRSVIIDSPYEHSGVFKRATLDCLGRLALSFPLQQTKILFTQTFFSPAVGAAMSIFLNYEAHDSQH
jgi:predicted NBD/HSP70 family sugar kinase